MNMLMMMMKKKKMKMEIMIMLVIMKIGQRKVAFFNFECLSAGQLHDQTNGTVRYVEGGRW